MGVIITPKAVPSGALWTAIDYLLERSCVAHHDFFLVDVWWVSKIQRDHPVHRSR